MGRALPPVLFAVLAASIWAPLDSTKAAETTSDSLVTVTTKDGNTYVGVITSANETAITITTHSGLVIRIPRDQISSMSGAETWKPEPVLSPVDPNYSRLLAAPTGRPLKKGDGYFSDVYVFLAGVAGGLTPQISVLVGMSIVPAVDLGDQLFYVAPKIGHQFSENFAASVGTLFFNVADVSGGLLWAVSTLGRVKASLTAGVGLGYLKESEDNEFDFSDDPIILIGGAVQTSGTTSLVSENWFIATAEISEMPFGIALRIFGDRLTADLGFLLIGEVLREGLPIPWLSVCYNFGPSRRAARGDRSKP